MTERDAVVERLHALGETLVEAEQVLALAALGPILEDDVGDAGVGEAGAVVERREPADGDHLVDAGLRAHALGDVVEGARRALERGAFGQLHGDQEVALVLDRQEGGRHAAQAVDRQGDEAGDDQPPSHRCARTMRAIRPA